jgi:predicted Zn-dependent protease
MRGWHGFVGAAWLAMFAELSWAQTPEPGAGQVQKMFSLGGNLAKDLDHKDGVITDPAVHAYLQHLEDRLAGAMGLKPARVRVTRSPVLYIQLLPNNVLFISGALLGRIESEAELAGLLAHELAHSRVVRSPVCVLGSQTLSWDAATRETERMATNDAIQTLRTIGYDPSALLELLSKLAYEHPVWARAIVPEDLLSLRAGLENDMPPQAGYLMNSSEFVELQARVSAALAVGVPHASNDRPNLTRR